MPRRIHPLDPPHPPEVADLLAPLVRPGTDRAPTFFRVLARHPDLMRAVTAGAEHAFSGRRCRISAREREVVALRTLALAGNRAEWEAHAAVWAERTGVTGAQLAATVDGDDDAACWSDTDRLLVRLAVELHGTARLPDELFTALRAHWTAEQVLDLVHVAGVYRSVSYLVDAMGLEPEDGLRHRPDPGRS